MSVKPRNRWRALGLVGLLSYACGAELDPNSACESACSAGACDVSGRCVPFATAAPSMRFDLELEPLPSSPFVTTQRSGVTPPRELGQIWNLVLPTPIIHETSVLGPDGAIDADLAFRSSESISDRPIDLVYRSRSDAPAQVMLPLGDYGVRISPLNPAYPPVQVDGFSVDRGPNARIKELALPQQYRQLSGLVRSRVQNTLTIPNVELVAYGIETGLASTVGVSDAEGFYKLLLPDTEDTNFRLSARLPESDEPTWQFEQIIRVPLNEDREKSVEIDLPSEAVQGILDLQIVGTGAGGPEPIPNARVVLTASVASDVPGRTYEVEGRTEADGILRTGDNTSIPILQGRYRVVVEPPTSSRFSRYEGFLDVDTVGNGLISSAQVALSERLVARGIVADADGFPLNYARLIFLPVESGDDPFARQTTVETDTSGRFEVQLEPGPHVVIVSPLDPDVRPRAAFAFSVRERGPSLALRLPAPSAIEGFVLTETQAPVEGVEVTLWSSASDVRFVASRARTDPNGAFRLVVAAESSGLE